MKALLFPYTFVLMNWAAVAGLYHFLSGQGDTWKEVWRQGARGLPGGEAFAGRNVREVTGEFAGELAGEVD